MAVFVDDMLLSAEVPNGNRTVRGEWSHLTATTTEELHAFAVGKLGMKRAWFQPARLVADNDYTRARCPERIGKPFPGSRDHYDLTAPVRLKAIKLGAVPCKFGCEPWRDRKREDRDADEIFKEIQAEGQPVRDAEADEVRAIEARAVAGRAEPEEAEAIRHGTTGEGDEPGATSGREPVNDGSRYRFD